MGIKRRSSAPAATDDDNDDDTVTTLRSKRRKDEDEPVRKSRASVVEDDDEDDLGDDEDDEDEDDRPARSSSIQPGREAARKVMKKNKSAFADEFRFGDEAALVKFASAEPFGSFQQHWIERQGKRSFICLTGEDPKGCPLCKAGDNPRSVAAYNIFVLSEDGDILDEPVVKALHAGPRLYDQIEAEHKGRSGPIDSNFWTLSRTGTKKGRYQTSVKAVKERDLEDDWDISPSAADKAMRKLKPYDASIFKLPTRKELLDVAREMNDGDD